MQPQVTGHPDAERDPEDRRGDGHQTRPPADPVALGVGDETEDDAQGAENEGEEEQGHPAADEGGDAEPTAAPADRGDG